MAACSEPNCQRMAARIESRIARQATMQFERKSTSRFDGKWHKFFAWRPICAWDDKRKRFVTVWMEEVDRKWQREDAIELSDWEYRVRAAA